MYRLLIVDDESYIVEDIKASVDWAKLGITTVLTANSMRQAKEILEKNPVDLMLSDIEMPQGNGLELLSHVRLNYPKVQTIFLTCHADFKYAKEAIRLGSLDYILKPIPYDELEASLAQAIQKINRDSELEEYSRFGQFWVKNQPVVVERFWLDILNHTIPSSQAEIRKAADYRNIPYSEQIKVIPVLVNVQKWRDKLSLRDEKIMEFGLKNVAEEVILTEGENGQFIPLQRGLLLGILSPGTGGQPGASDYLVERCTDYIAKCRQYLACELSCYIGKEVFTDELSSMVDQLLNLKKDNVAFFNKVFMLSKDTTARVKPQVRDMSTWSVMIKEGLVDKLIKEVKDELTNLSLSTGLNASILYHFQQDFLQILYSSLEQKGIHAHQLLSDNESIELQIQASQSVEGMLAWVRYAVEKLTSYAAEVSKTQSVVQAVKDYVALHLQEEIAREEIANLVFLNPDYLDRIFKKEMNVSVSKYIINERMRIAQELLSLTEIPVSTVAAKVGYCNPSNFSSIFKKATGLSPAEYRKNMAKPATSGQAKS